MAVGAVAVDLDRSINQDELRKQTLTDGSSGAQQLSSDSELKFIAITVHVTGLGCEDDSKQRLV